MLDDAGVQALAVEDLSGEMREVARIIGHELTTKLLERFGGWRVYVPARATARCELSRVIGVDAAAQLSQAFGSGFLWVPKCTAALLAKRDREIRARVNAGEKVFDVARDVGVSVRRLYKILKKP